MSNEEHYRKLEEMFHQAPINEFYEPHMTISEGNAQVEMKVQEKFHHAAHALHGAVYFKMLDDAAYFAANSVVTDYFLVTTQFNLYFLRPVKSGNLIAKGELTFYSPKMVLADARIFNEKGDEVAYGSGTFIQSNIRLSDKIGYNK